MRLSTKNPPGATTRLPPWLGGALAAASVACAVFSCSGENPSTTTSSTSSGTGGGTSNGTGGAGGTGGSTTTTSSTSSTSSGNPGDRCAAITASINDAGFSSKVSVTCDGQYAHVVGDTYPDHDKMNGITGTNEQVPVPAAGHSSPIPLSPAPSGKNLTVDGAVGIAVNGVPIYDYTSQGMLDPSQYDPKSDTLLNGQLDHCNGHAGRGDDYHYHAAPICMMEAMKNKGPGAIIGWALDGYPVYGNDNPDGTPIAAGELDVCNGKEDPTFGRRYHTSDGHPYIVQCLTGQVDENLLPRVPPLDNAAGGGKPPGMPPQGGVQDLTYNETPDGTRTMTYTYKGTGYHISYKPSAKPGCYDFEQQTVTNGGVVEKATYCRKMMP
ncbi:MAG: YHYH protein [Byssovorax sp.]